MVKVIVGTELDDKETYLIGAIVAQWGFLENEIFEQTLLSYADEESLPRAMNNLQFSAVLELWKQRVVETSADATKRLFHAQYDEIVKLSPFRQAIIHSRWKWHADRLDVITAVRVAKDQIISVDFDTESLTDFMLRLGEVRRNLQYPGGEDERLAELEAMGGRISRSGYRMLFGKRSDN